LKPRNQNNQTAIGSINQSVVNEVPSEGVQDPTEEEKALTEEEKALVIK